MPSLVYLLRTSRQSREEIVQLLYEVPGPKSNTTLMQTPKFEWYMSSLVVKNGQQQDICYDEHGLWTNPLTFSN